MTTKEYFAMQGRRSKGVTTLRDYQRNKKNSLSQTINFDTFESDLNSLGTNVQSIYDGWQTEETMKNTRSSIESMHTRLNAYQEYQKMFGGADLTEVSNSYKTILEGWDERTNLYGQYKNADAFKVASTKAKLSDQFRVKTGTNAETGEDEYRGLTFDEVQAKLKEYKPDSDEYKFLSAYTGYTDLNDFNKALESATDKKSDYYRELETAANVRKLDHKFDLYKHYMDAEDFEEKSQYKSTKGENDAWWQDTSDKVYEYINGDGETRAKLQSNHDIYQADAPIYTPSQYAEKSLDQMTKEEIKVFNYIYATQGKENAHKYLNDMQITLNKRSSDATASDIKKTVDESAFASAVLSVASVPMSVGGSLLGFAGSFSGNPYNIYNSVANAASTIRTEVGENIAEGTEGFEIFGQNIPSFLYSTGMSIGDTLLGGASFGSAYSVIAGANAYQQKAKELTEAGENKDVVIKTALASGAAEVVFEFLSLEKLFSIKNVDSKLAIVKSAIKQAGFEGSEEFFTEIANIVSDSAIRGKNSELYKDYEELKARGFSDKEIKTELAKKVGSQVTWAFAGGALSGAGLGTAQSIRNYHDMKSVGSTIRGNERTQDLLDVARLTPRESEAYNLYTDYALRNNPDNITDAQLGSLYTQAHMDAESTLKSKKTSNDAKIKAKMTQMGLAIVDTKNTIEKPSGNTDVVEDIKLSEENLVENESEMSIDEMTIAQRDAELKAQAESIGNDFGENMAELFLSQYDGKTEVERYATSFRLMTEYGNKNFTPSVMLENKGVLSTDQVTAIYGATVKANIETKENALKTITDKQGKNVFVKGTFDDSIIDYKGTTTDGSKVNWSDLKPQQRSAIKFAKLFSKATGVNIKFIKSEIKNGKHKGENGSYDPATNTISIDVFAGRINVDDVNNSIIPTLSHEITHWMKEKAPTIYNNIREDVMSTLAKGNRDRLTGTELIKQEMERIKRNHPEMDVAEEDAIDELVARSCEDMLSNSDAARELLSKMTEAEQRTFIDKVKAVFENLMKWVNDLLSQYKSESAEAEILRNYGDMLNKVSKQWDEMLLTAVQTNQALQHEGIIAEELVNGISKDGTTIVGKNNIQMSERTYAEGGRDFLANWLDEQKGLSQEDKKSILEQTDAIASLMKDIRENNELPDYARWAAMDVVKDENGEKVLSVIVKNGDYAMNIDFSQVCKKRVALNAVLNAMVQSGDLNAYTLTETDVADLNAIIKEHEFEIACALCFVDSKRYRVGSWAESFCEGTDKKKNGKMVHQYGFNEMVRSLIPKGSKIQIDEFNFTNREIIGQPTSNLLSEMDDSELDFTLIDEILEREFKAGSKPTDLYAYAKAIKDNKELRKILNPAEIISSIGLDAIRLDSPELYRLINRHQGTAKPKFAHDVVAYTNDILKASNFTKEKAKMVGGVRCQSFSDFMANMVFDYVQFISELSAKELTAHSYTKEPLFVRLFGLTGMKINMSLVPKAVQMTPEQQEYFAILNDKNANKRSAEYKKAKSDYAKLTENAGLDENGNYIWEDETFPYDIAMELVVDPRYSANCGTIAVGISDNHILKLLNDDNISMVIPYHKSGLNHIVAMMRNIDLYNDYTTTQNTRFANGKKLEKVPDFDFYGDLYGTDGKEGTHNPKKTAENYLKWCDEHNYIPKFEKSRIGRKFRDNPNYYKLLIDFRVYDTDGAYREQQAVKPIYPEKEEFRDLILNGVKDKNGKVYGGLKQQQGTSDKLDAESQQIVDEFRNRLKEKYGKDVLATKNSDRDSEGNELSEEQIEFFKDSKVRDKEGNLLVMYHGTPNGEFNTFQISDGTHNSLMAQYGAGYYFDSNKDSAKRYTKDVNKTVANRKPKVFETYLNIKNPLVIHDEYLNGRKPVITKQQFMDVVSKGNYEWMFTNGMPFELTKYLEKPKSEIQQLSREEIIKHWVNMVYERAYFDSDILSAMVKAYKGDSILSVMKDVFGNDGVQVIDKYGEMWVAWDNSQIKETTNTNPTTNTDIRYSDRDSEGNTLTNEQIEYFKDSKIRDKNGNLLVVRHGTSEDFHIFDFSKAGKNGKAEGAGFYFSDEKEITSRYGDIQKEVYLNITKPMYNTKRTVKKAELVKFVNDLIDFDNGKWGTEWKDSFISNYVNTYEFQMSRRYAVQQFVNQIWEYNTNDQDLIFEVAQADGRTYENSTMKEFYDVLTESIGYDGIIAEWTHSEGKSNVYVTFNSEQSKYTNNTKPTSNLDMRYADRENPNIANYTETQYNNFGWVRYNNVLTTAEYNTLISRYADYKHNKNVYPTTRFGEAVVFSFDYPDVLMYVKGTIKKPQITKVVKITEDNIELLKTIREEILKYEYQQVPLPYQNVQFIFGEGILDIHRRQDFTSFQGYKRQRERELGKENNFLDRVEQDGRGSIKQGETLDEVKLSDRDYVITDNRAAFTEKHINDLYEDYSVSSTSDMMKDYAQAYVTYINPSDFLSITSLNGERIRNEVIELDLEKLQAKDDRELPYLEFDEETGEVYEHDGRHRLIAFENAGIEQVAIRLLPISQENKYHRRKTDITLKGQEFNWRNEKGEIVSGRAKGEVKVTAYPLSPSNRPVIEQLFGTGKMLYSDRDNVSVYDQMGETDRLIKENEKLKEDITRLKGIIGNEEIPIRRFRSLADYLKKQTGSNVSREALGDMLNDAYTFIQDTDNIQWGDVVSKTYDIANYLINRNLSVPVNYFKEVMSKIRKDTVSLTEKQKTKAGDMFGGYSNFHKTMFGRINITTGGKPLSEMWQEWSKAYPEIFKADVKAENQIEELVNIVDTLKETSSLMGEFEREEAIRHLSVEVYNQFWNIASDSSDIAKDVKAQHRKMMEEMRKGYEERQLEKTLHPVGETALKYEAFFNKVARTHKNEIANIKKRSAERMDAYKENAERKTKIQSITANALTLNKWLVKNSKDEHIHEAMKEPVAKLLNAIDFSSRRKLEKGEPTQKDVSFAKAFAEVEKMLIKANNGEDGLIELYGHDLGEGIKMLVDAADRLVGDNNYVINKMTLEELNHLDRLVKYIKKVVTDLNKFHTVNHAKGIANMSQESMGYLDKLGKAKIYDGLRGAARKLVNWGNSLPYYVFKRYGEGGTKVFEAFQDGWDKFAFHIKEIIDYANKTYSSKEVKEWGNEIKEFKILIPPTDIEKSDPNYKPKHQTVQMSVSQIMSMYCLVKREQARNHMIQGGIRIADIKREKGEIISQSDGVVLTYTDVVNIISSLSVRQKAVADKLQEFMNTTCTDWGNEVSMLRFGIKSFGEENYFPIQSDSNNLAVNDETEKNNSLFRLLNMSFTKSTVENANNRIVISDIFDVFAQHTSDMAKYNALALPVLDAFKWYNYNEKTEKGDGTFITKGVKQSIETAFGKDGQNYFTTFLKDLNGEKEVTRDTLGRHFFTSAKIAAVGMNLRVMALQPTSYLRASAVIDNKYLTKALFHTPKINKAEKHCGMALWKSMGYYDTNVQRGVEEQIKHDNTWKDKAVEVSMKGAEIADKLTWGYLWNACELEVRDKRKDLKVGSDEFYKEIGKKLREVIYATQVVDSTMTRSQMMRSSNAWDKMLTAFASEPTLAYNMLQDAYMGLQLDAKQVGKKEALKKNGKKIARVVTAYTLTNLIAALVESGFDALRDEEEEEMDIEEFMKMYLTNFATDMSIISKIPYIKEMVSIFSGYGSSRTDTQWMESFANAIKGWMKVSAGEGNPVTATKHSLRAISYLSGLPFYNAYRDFMATLNKLDILTAEDLEEMFEGFFE